MELKLQIENAGVLYEPPVEDGVVWETVRKGTPGKLNFSVVKDGVLSFTEGNAVRLEVDGVRLFLGYVFTKRRSKRPSIDVTAYDQLRYLKNKDTILFEPSTAAQRLEEIARRFQLECGDIEDSGLVLPKETKRDKTLIDMLLDDLDDTARQTGRLYALYDDYGRLALRDIQHLALDLLIDAETGESFDYTSSIDQETYNQVKLSFLNEKQGKIDNYVVMDSENIEAWGLLQHHAVIDEKDVPNAPDRAEALLKFYDQKTRSLSIKGALGDLRVRAGSMIAVSLDLGDLMLSNQLMIVERAKHTFKNQEHRMDLTLIGRRDFIA